MDVIYQPSRIKKEYLRIFTHTHPFEMDGFYVITFFSFFMPGRHEEIKTNKGNVHRVVL
jgi:hypothetical protein